MTEVSFDMLDSSVSRLYGAEGFGFSSDVGSTTFSRSSRAEKTLGESLRIDDAPLVDTFERQSIKPDLQRYNAKGQLTDSMSHTIPRSKASLQPTATINTVSAATAPTNPSVFYQQKTSSVSATASVTPSIATTPQSTTGNSATWIIGGIKSRSINTADGLDVVTTYYSRSDMAYATIAVANTSKPASSTFPLSLTTAFQTWSTTSGSNSSLNGDSTYQIPVTYDVRLLAPDGTVLNTWSGISANTKLTWNGNTAHDQAGGYTWQAVARVTGGTVLNTVTGINATSAAPSDTYWAGSSGAQGAVGAWERLAQTDVSTTAPIDATTQVSLSLASVAAPSPATVNIELLRPDGTVAHQWNGVAAAQTLTYSAAGTPGGTWTWQMQAATPNGAAPATYTASIQASASWYDAVGVSSVPTYGGLVWTAQALSSGGTGYYSDSGIKNIYSEELYYYYGPDFKLYADIYPGQVRSEDMASNLVGDVRTYWLLNNVPSTATPTYGGLAWTTVSDAAGNAIGWTAAVGNGQYYYVDKQNNLFINSYAGPVHSSDTSANYVAWAPWYFAFADNANEMQFDPVGYNDQAISVASPAPVFDDPQTWSSDMQSAFNTAFQNNPLFSGQYKDAISSGAPIQITFTYDPSHPGSENYNNNTFTINISPDKSFEPRDITFAHELMHLVDDIHGIDTDVMYDNNALYDINGLPISPPTQQQDPSTGQVSPIYEGQLPDEKMNPEELRGEVAGAVEAYLTNQTGSFQGPDWLIVHQHMTFTQFDQFIFDHYGMHIKDIAKDPKIFFGNISLGRQSPQYPEVSVGGGYYDINGSAPSSWTGWFKNPETYAPAPNPPSWIPRQQAQY